MLILIFGANEERAMTQFRKVRAEIDPSAVDGKLAYYYKNDTDTIIANSELSPIRCRARAGQIWLDVQCDWGYILGTALAMLDLDGELAWFGE